MNKKEINMNKKEIKKAIETFNSEIFALRQYMKDKERRGRNKKEIKTARKVLEEEYNLVYDIPDKMTTKGFREIKYALQTAIKVMGDYEGMKKQVIRVEAEKDHLKGIKFVPNMQSWEDLTGERNELKAEVERLKEGGGRNETSIR